MRNKVRLLTGQGHERPAPHDAGYQFNWCGIEDLVIERDEVYGVYFVKAAHAIKIGYTIDLTARMTALQTGNHEQLQFLGIIPCPMDEERKIHARFAHLRIHHEWFHDDPEIRLYLLERLTVSAPA